MTTYPLQTLACTIDSTGISAPAYADILLSLQASYRNIYGSDVVLDADTQDGQFLAVLASAINDSNAATIAVYNSFSPATAQGNGLSSVVKINGIQRQVPSQSTADLTIVGQAGTVISNGLVADSFGNQWALPSTVTIPVGGSIVATATCTVAGAITAGANTITSIVNPTRGWQTATNAAAATVGVAVEDDATLRQRQSQSTASPAQTINAAIVAGLKALPGVTGVVLYENATNSTDANGIPAHSISVVVEGGDATQIATTIAQRKTEGCGTYGTTSVPLLLAGESLTINFYRPTSVRILAEIDITALTGYLSTTGTQLVAAAAAYVSALPIGGDVYNTKVSTAANLDGASLADTYNLTAVKLAKSPSSPTVQDIVIAFNEVASLAVGDVSLIVT